MGTALPFRRSGDREGSGFAADLLPVRSHVLDGAADYQSHRAAEQGIQTKNPSYGSDRRRDLDLSLFSVRFADHGVPLEFSSALPMVDSLHTNCRLTGWKLSRLVGGARAERVLDGSGRRRHEHHAGALGGGGNHLGGGGGARGLDRALRGAAGAVRGLEEPLPALRHGEGATERRGADHAVWTHVREAGDRTDRGQLAAGPGASRAGARDASGRRCGGSRWPARLRPMRIWSRSICPNTTGGLRGKRPDRKIITAGRRGRPSCIRSSVWRASAPLATTG